MIAGTQVVGGGHEADAIAVAADRGLEGGGVGVDAASAVLAADERRGAGRDIADVDVGVGVGVVGIELGTGRERDAVSVSADRRVDRVEVALRPVALDADERRRVRHEVADKHVGVVVGVAGHQVVGRARERHDLPVGADRRQSGRRRADRDQAAGRQRRPRRCVAGGAGARRAADERRRVGQRITDKDVREPVVVVWRQLVGLRGESGEAAIGARRPAARRRSGPGRSPSRWCLTAAARYRSAAR